MKNIAITNALRDGDLRPKERVLLLVQNDVAKDLTGNESLTEADKHALCEGWRPKNNDEVHEYNKYNEGRRLLGAAELDAQTTFMGAQSEHFREQTFLINLSYYPYYRQMRSMLDRLEKIKSVSVQEAMAIAEKQKVIKLRDGLDFDYALYKIAFERLSAEDKKRFNELYPDIETDHAYLDQEEIIANLLAGKNTLTQKNKEKLAALIAEKSYNKFAKEYQLFHYFACIPITEVARKFLEDKGIAIDGKSLASNQELDDGDDQTHDATQRAIEKYAKENNIAIDAILKEACLAWLDEDLFECYTPLVLSDDNELFGRWLAEKVEAKAILKRHIAKDELRIRDRSPDESQFDKLYSKGLYDDELEKSLLAMEAMGLELHLEAQEQSALDEKTAFAAFSDKVITGESLYISTADYKFVKDFKEDADTYDPNLGLVYADDDSEHRGEHLDQELLIADKNSAGELNIFSQYGIATRRLSALLESGVFLKETDGGITLEFKDAWMETAFADMRDNLIEGYATLSAFEEMFKRLSNIYEVDLGYRIKKWLQAVGEYINQHNSALREATGQARDESGSVWLRQQPILKINGAFFINKEKIRPSYDKVMLYLEKCKEIFGSEFGPFEEQPNKSSV